MEEVKPSAIRSLLMAVLLTSSVSSTRGEDWPTYMHDDARSGVSGEALSLPLRELWCYRPVIRRETAWSGPQKNLPELPKLDFDSSTHVVAAGDTVYFGSPVDHAVYAVDATDGSVRWRFFTGGPVRVSPTIAGDQLYSGSDDGFVYCLDRKNGSLKWKTRPLGSDQMIIGARQLMSLWPVRTGIVVKDGKIYCGAGLFPYHGTALVCLDGKTGKVLWLAKGGKKEKGKRRRTPYPIPQGYLVCSDTHIWVPCGRAPPQFYRLSDGIFTGMPSMRGSKDYFAGSFATMIPVRKSQKADDKAEVEDQFYCGAQNRLFGCKPDGSLGSAWMNTVQVMATPKQWFRLGSTFVATKGRRFLQVGEKTLLQAIDRSLYEPALKKRLPKPAVQWIYADRNLRTMILAGNHVIVGGENKVTAINAKTGKADWQGHVNGIVLSLAVTKGHLFAGTDNGRVYCFGQEKARNSRETQPAAPAWKSTPEIDSLANAIAHDAGLNRGYGLVLGRDAVLLATALAEKTGMLFHAVEPDTARAAEARHRLTDAGIYGTKVVVDSRSGNDGFLSQYPQYFANLVICTKGNQLEKEKSLSDELLRILKPFGGRLYCGTGPPGRQPESVIKCWQQAGTLTENLTLQGSGRHWTRLVRGGLPGGGQWTHQYGDAANTGSSGDKLIEGKFRVLWYGSPGPDKMQDRHSKTQSPLLIEGRVYAQGVFKRENKPIIMCFDAYNGVAYWEREIPGAKRLGISHNCGNLAACPAGLFAAIDDHVLQLSPKNGETIRTFPLPEHESASKTKPTWAFLALVGNTLVGSASNSHAFSNRIFAYDIPSGKLKWQYQGDVIRNATLTVADGTVLFVEHRGQTQPPKVLTYEEFLRLSVLKRKKLSKKKKPEKVDYKRTVVALDLASGKEKWSTEVDLTDCGSWKNNLSGAAGAGVFALFGTYTAYGRPTGKEPKRRVLAVAIADGKLLWNKPFGNCVRPVIVGDRLISRPNAVYLKTGEPLMMKIRNKQKPWRIPTLGACGQMSASECFLFYRIGQTFATPISQDRARMAFIGMRPGCLINILPACGVVVQVEASSGCRCPSTALQSTITFVPVSAK